LTPAHTSCLYASTTNKNNTVWPIIERISRLFTASFIKAGGFLQIFQFKKYTTTPYGKAMNGVSAVHAPHSSKMTKVSDNDSIFYIW